MESTPFYGLGAKIPFDKAEEKSQAKVRVEPKELRKNPRKTISKPIYFAAQNEYLKGVIKNISRNGAFIETRAKFSNEIKVKLVVLGVNKYLLIKCNIVHFSQTGFGVKFKRILKIKKPLRVKKYSDQTSSQQNI